MQVPAKMRLIDTLLSRLSGVFFLTVSLGAVGFWVVGSWFLSDLSKFDTELATISRGHEDAGVITQEMESLLVSTQQVSADFSLGPRVRDGLAGLRKTVQSCASAPCHGPGARARVLQIEPIVTRQAQTLEPLVASKETRPEIWAAWSAEAEGALKEVNGQILVMLQHLSHRAEQVRSATQQAAIRTYRRVLLAGVVCTILGALAVLLIMLDALRPLVRLREGMRRSSGNIMVEDVAVGGPKEIRDLAHSFNEMVARVKDYQRQFERRATDLFRLMMETSIDGFWIADGQGRILEVNDAYCRLTGYSREEVLAMGIPDLEVKETPEETAAHIRAVSQSGHDRFETRHRRKDGSTLDVEVSVQLLKSKPDRFVCFLRDITDRMQAEVRLRHLDKMEALGRLTAGVVHEFNNLLTVVRMASRVVSDDIPADSPAQKDLEEVNRAVARASEISRKLLAFSRDQKSQPEVASLNSIVARMEKLLQTTVGSRVKLLTELNPDTGDVCVDPTEMEQVLINLVINARDAMPNGGKLTVGTSRLRLDEALKHSYGEIGPGSYAVLLVADTGTGMSPGIQAHLFEPFFTTKGPEKGTGLGLSIVHGIISRSNGHIRCDSQVGRGTTFQIYLPAVEPHAAP